MLYNIDREEKVAWRVCPFGIALGIEVLDVMVLLLRVLVFRAFGKQENVTLDWNSFYIRKMIKEWILVY